MSEQPAVDRKCTRPPTVRSAVQFPAGRSSAAPVDLHSADLTLVPGPKHTFLLVALQLEFVVCPVIGCRRGGLCRALHSTNNRPICYHIVQSEAGQKMKTMNMFGTRNIMNERASSVSPPVSGCRVFYCCHRVCHRVCCTPTQHITIRWSEGARRTLASGHFEESQTAPCAEKSYTCTDGTLPALEISPHSMRQSPPSGGGETVAK